ncbi:hypothetical protein CROQUDRAFT_652715 [Cronartium quercuum f. sp. fusiforme G11]|uniref:Uncharacterized protein n=1 Tax=Cronartium quercuum f. sp. fusiforme G11 TaxID=708437 RepID=A0A9P6NTP3_9BASI|nr:hypothetical protein CROQUDRAFT_652715 [Cronartium quercuum f. sp. fusiforme G11]
MSSNWNEFNQTPNSRKRNRENDNAPDSSYRRRYNDNQHHHQRGPPRRPPPGAQNGDNPDPFLLTIWRLGDSERFDFRREIPEAVHLIEQHFKHWPADVLTAFRIAAVELPHKLPHYALLIALLSTPSNSASISPDQTQQQPIGLQVIKELSRSFQQHIDKRRWRSTRLSVQLFAQLNLLQRPLVSDKSLLALLKAFVRVLSDDLTCSVSRADECLRVAAEGLLRSGLWVRYGTSSNGDESNGQGGKPSNPVDDQVVSMVEDQPITSKTEDQSVATKTEKGSTSKNEEATRPETESSTIDQSIEVINGSSEQPHKTTDTKIDHIVENQKPKIPAVTAEEAAELRKEVSELVSAIKAHHANRSLDRTLFNASEAQSHYVDPIDELVLALDRPSLSVFPVLDTAFEPFLESRLPNGVEYPDPLDLPVVLLPPDDDEEQTVTGTGGGGGGGGGQEVEKSKDRTGYLGVRVFVRLFIDETVPNRETADGVLLRTLVHDIIDLFEVNRKECARILLDLPRWVGRGTFKSKGSQAQEKEKIEGPSWILEHTLVETIVSSIFGMPTPPIRPPVYYTSLIAELCRLSPATVAPALGKAMRRLFGNLPDVLEPEGIRRFADWFAVHLSNFGFLWVWKDWVEVTEMEIDHPKRVLVARILELEIRLSYFDRIAGTVPESYTTSGVMPSQAPAPIYTYEFKDHPHHLACSDIVQLLKRKEPVSRLTEYLGKMAERLRKDEGLEEEEASTLERSLATQAILFVGSRSFSHFLNVLERYLELLKTLTTNRGQRLELLRTVKSFWSLNPEFELIVLDKLLEYRIVKPVELLSHVFNSSNRREINFWDGLSLALGKVRRRVDLANKRVSKIRREVEDQRDLVRAAAAAGNTDNEEVKEEVGGREKELAEGISELEGEKGEQVEVLKALVQAFAKELKRPEAETEGESKWMRWWVQGWTREFCRSYANEVVDHYEILVEALEEEHDGIVKGLLERTKEWVELVGRAAH